MDALKHACMYIWLDGCTHALWLDECTHTCMYVWLDGCTHAWMDVWLECWMDRWEIVGWVYDALDGFVGGCMRA